MADTTNLRAERDAADAAAIAQSAENRRQTIAATQAAIQRAERLPSEADANAVQLIAGLDALIRELMGPVPWVRYVGLGQVVKVFKADGYCTVSMAGDGANVQDTRHVRIGAGTPVVGKTYPVYQPFGLPPAEQSLIPGPVPAGDPFLHAPGGFFLYYATQLWQGDGNYTLGITRMPWPPTDVQTAEFLVNEPASVDGYDLFQFIGVDGLGNLWFSVQTETVPPTWGVFYHPDSGRGVRSSVIATGAVQYLAVDCTPGKVNLVGMTTTTTDAPITRVETPLEQAVFDAWLHLQSDGGTTFAAGDPGPGDFQYGIRDSVAEYEGGKSINPSGVTSRGHYIPPNDGTTAAPHYHWYSGTLPAGTPITRTYHDQYQSALNIYVARGTVSPSGAVSLAGSIVASPVLTGPPVMFLYYTPGAYRPENLLSADEAIGAVLAAGSITAVYHGDKIYPVTSVLDDIGHSNYRRFLGKRPFIFTVQDGEDGGGLGDVGTIVYVLPTQQQSDPDIQWRDFAKHPAVVEPPLTFPIEASNLSIVGPTTTFGQAIWAVGPAGKGAITGLAGWWVNQSDVNNPPLATWQQIAGGGFKPLHTVYYEVWASDRAVTNLLAAKDPFRNAQAFSLDGGATWADLPIKLPFYPGPNNGEDIHGSYGYIVEA